MVFKEYQKEIENKKKIKSNADVIERRTRIIKKFAKEVDVIVDVLNYRNNDLFTKANGKLNSNIIINIALFELIIKLEKMSEEEAEQFILEWYMDITERYGRKIFNTKKQHR